jgi:hypothetical protein
MPVPALVLSLALVFGASALTGTGSRSAASDLILASGTVSPPAPNAPMTPEQKMQRRYPQPVKVGDLIGLRVLDDDDRTLGRIRMVVRTPEGKIQLVVPYGGFLGLRQRLVAVPIEVVAIAGRQVAALDMDRAAFDTAPTWTEGTSPALPASEMIRIALYKR